MSSFKFVSLLSGLHLLASGWFVRVLRGGAKRGSETKLDVETMLLILWTVSSLQSLNISLMINSVSFYQAMKLLIIPCSAMIEYYYGGNPMSHWQMFFVFQTLVGVALITINDLTFDINMRGVVIAMISVITSSLQQTSVRKLQSVRKMESFDLVALIAPGSGAILVIFSPIMDYNIANQWITEYNWGNMVIWGILLSTSLAILVNLSQFLCLGKFSAVEFQMMGHVKTVIIFTTSWFVLHENFSNIKWLGCLLTISGIYLFNEYSKYHKCQEEAKKENLFSGHHEELRKLFATK